MVELHSHRKMERERSSIQCVYTCDAGVDRCIPRTYSGYKAEKALKLQELSKCLKEFGATNEPQGGAAGMVTYKYSVGSSLRGDWTVPSAQDRVEVLYEYMNTVDQASSDRNTRSRLVEDAVRWLDERMNQSNNDPTNVSKARVTR